MLLDTETSFPIKQKLCFLYLLKRINLTLILDNGSTYKMNDSSNEINAFVLEKLNRENCVCRMKMGLFAKIVLRKNFLTLEFLWFCDDFKENKG